MLAPGQLIGGKYRILSLLGSGGMGLVYVAEHERLSRRVALKTLHATSSGDAMERFRREAVALARVRSPYVAEALDADVLEDGTPYLVMELLEGRDLRAELRQRGPLPIGEAVAYVAQACIGVAAAHAVEIVHRDLKPNNLFLARHGNNRRVKVVDFGIAKFLDADAAALTNSHLALGTPLYMSPEHLREPKNVGKASDVWALGVVLYELLAGFSPFADETAGAIVAAIALDAPVWLSEVRPDVPEELSRIVDKVLLKDRRERTATPEALRRALEPFAASESTFPADTTLTGEAPRAVLPKPWPRRAASEVRREIQEHVDHSDRPEPISGVPTLNDRPGERLARVPSVGLISVRPTPLKSVKPQVRASRGARVAAVVVSVTAAAAVVAGALIANANVKRAAPPPDSRAVEATATTTTTVVPGVPVDAPTPRPALSGPIGPSPSIFEHVALAPSRVHPRGHVITPSAIPTTTPFSVSPPSSAADGNPLHL
jgi:serine/threonine protein kinase